MTEEELRQAIARRDVARLRELRASGAGVDTLNKLDGREVRLEASRPPFEMACLLLDAGLSLDRFGWTRLHRAVACGTLDDIRAALAEGAELEVRDSWQRTPFLLAVETGDVARAELLVEHGADIQVRGHIQQTALLYAIETQDDEMLVWLIDRGVPLDGRDQFGHTPLRWAADEGSPLSVELLIYSGAPVDEALQHTYEAGKAVRLLKAGADPQNLEFEARRDLLGLPPEPDLALLDATPEDYATGHAPRFGTSNPERMDVPFWHAMIRAGVDAYTALEALGGTPDDHPIWCAQRFGQSLTFLPNGRIIQVAGEHEDSYDPDFCIYNDVFVHHPDGRIEIYGYPEAVFPPTDFHTATSVGDTIWLIGSVGYLGQRRYGETPVYRLDTQTYRIEPVETTGNNPGWTSHHRADLLEPGRIWVSDGSVCRAEQGRETFLANPDIFILDLERLVWTRNQG